ncbi:metallophosphoesterase family protein [Sphingomonas sp. GC_Shp_3]|uniref:metallophosphoesterase family protein n=1 Tax=Sphingomonas sp. GC_Shp_3 TaxID=2937383 RepID=UPI00226A057A|nr:metallophosphoesterase family protein [Sphingomonas sp. GC_Shp_3]
MLRRIFNRPRERQPERRPVAAWYGSRLYAIGDIHGRRDLLDDVLRQIEEQEAQSDGVPSEIIFLGDLIDRGPDSADVVERVVQLRASGRPVSVLLGNHEEIFLRILRGEFSLLPMFLKMGGRETVLSYGITREEYDTLSNQALAERLRVLVPHAHFALFNDCDVMVFRGDYAFVHAGIRPGVALADQKEEDLRWIRSPFLESNADHGRIIVHGHTVSEEPEIRANRIGIDTGAVYSDRLTVLGIDRTRRWLFESSKAPGDTSRRRVA